MFGTTTTNVVGVDRDANLRIAVVGTDNAQDYRLIFNSGCLVIHNIKLREGDYEGHFLEMTDIGIKYPLIYN